MNVHYHEDRCMRSKGCLGQTRQMNLSGRGSTEDLANPGLDGEGLGVMALDGRAPAADKFQGTNRKVNLLAATSCNRRGGAICLSVLSMVLKEGRLALPGRRVRE
ncbi:hypothetical protein POX_g08614 [Penicillium oxalicum]|uniref:hypothetical protein n=1 Tax=Penicillium oxalicum TaxID=69781 RepID=UPI0020B8B600|nr:hypothetical protein POX_g08614 [Penicillium oxalicum]KAI2786232.1 hypothetical protein POX_g08614 [Penicillium oxalicum]